MALLLAAGLFAFYLTVQYGDFYGWDGRTMANVAHNVVERGQLVVTRDVSWWVPELRGDKSPFGIGLSLVLIPFWAVQRLVDPDHGYVLTLANPLVTAATAVIVYRTGLALGWRRTTGVLTALAFGVLTMAPVYSIELFSEPSVGLCLSVALLGLLRVREPRRSGPWMVGGAAGVACLFRYDSFLLIVPLVAAVPLFAGRGSLRRHWRRWSLPLLAPTVLALGWTLYYNQYRFGSVFAVDTGGGFGTPIMAGLERQLLSPGKGFFWYDPVLLAGLPGMWLLYRRQRGVVVVVLALFLARACYFATYYNPDGSVAWGPRYLTPLCPLLVLGVGELLERRRSLPRGRRAVVALAVTPLALAGAAVTFAGLWVPYTYSLFVIGDVPGRQTMPVSRLAAIEAERTDRQFNDWYWSPIALNLRSLAVGGRSHPPGFPLLWWRGGPSPTGVLTLSVGVAGTAAAVAAARSRDRHPHR